MRKKTILLSMLLPLAALIAACSRQEDITTEQPPQLPETQLRPMTFRATGSPLTRANEIPFQGEKYPVFMTALCGSDNVVPEGKCLFWDDVDRKFIADGCVWPKSGTVQLAAFSTSTGKKMEHGVASLGNGVSSSTTATGQTITFAEEIDGHDNVMFAAQKVNIQENMTEPTLHFKHAMAKPNVKMNQVDTMVVRLVEIEFLNLKRNGTLTVNLSETEPTANWNTSSSTLKGGRISMPHYEIDTLAAHSAQYQMVDSLYLLPNEDIWEIKVFYKIYDKYLQDWESGDYTYRLNQATSISAGAERTLKLKAEPLVLAHGKLNDRKTLSPGIDIFDGLVTCDITEEIPIDEYFDDSKHYNGQN